MRVIDKMGIDVNSVEGLVKICSLMCGDIPDTMGDPSVRCGENDCITCKMKRLLTPIPMKKVSRWSTIKSNEDLCAIIDEWFSLSCEGDNCFNTNSALVIDCIKCLKDYLCADVEVEA